MAETEGKRRGWRRRLQAVVVQLLLLLGLLYAAEAFLGWDKLGTEAPHIEASTIAGEKFSLQQFAGEPAVIHFWATWCPICEFEQQTVEKLGSGSALITIAMQSGGADEVRDYMKRQGVDYAVINDPQGLLSERYGVKAVPASYIIDGEGKIRFATRGYTSGLGLRLRLWLAGWF